MSLALFVVWTAVCAAGQVRGTIHVGRTPVAGRTVEITTGKNVYTTKTAKDGSFKLNVHEPFKLNVHEHGRCVLSLVGKRRLSIAIDSRKQTMVYDLEVVKRNGKYTLIKTSKNK
jgi:hypothetical protein